MRKTQSIARAAHPLASRILGRSLSRRGIPNRDGSLALGRCDAARRGALRSSPVALRSGRPSEVTDSAHIAGVVCKYVRLPVAVGPKRPILHTLGALCAKNVASPAPLGGCVTREAVSRPKRAFVHLFSVSEFTGSYGRMPRPAVFRGLSPPVGQNVPEKRCTNTVFVLESAPLVTHLPRFDGRRASAARDRRSDREKQLCPGIEAVRGMTTPGAKGNVVVLPSSVAKSGVTNPP